MLNGHYKQTLSDKNRHFQTKSNKIKHFLTKIDVFSKKNRRFQSKKTDGFRQPNLKKTRARSRNILE